jgi:pimeloyl-ACP methyl ester carboxylesterase
MSDLFFARPDGTRLRVDATPGDGLPVVFQHGLCGDARQTAEVFPDDGRIHRITVEMRGHGGSDAGDPSTYSIATFTDDLAAFIDARLSAPAIVGGISMGAAIALRLAVRRPDLVRALVLARPAWVTDAAPPNMAPNAEVGRLLQRLAPGVAKETFLRSDTARRLSDEAPDNLASLTGFFARQPVDVTSALLTSISGDGPGVTRGEVARVAVPTLVIGIARDSVHPLAYAQTIVTMVRRAELVEITSKATDRARYVSEFRSVMRHFLENVIRVERFQS